MLLLRTDTLPDSKRGLYELKLDGYRAIAFKRNGTVYLRSVGAFATLFSFRTCGCA